MPRMSIGNAQAILSNTVKRFNSVTGESFGLIFTWRGELSVIGSQDFKDFVTNYNVPIWRSIACPNICTISKPSHEEHLLDFHH